MSDHDCPEAFERIQLYLDGELSEVEIVEISTHLADCYPCGTRVEFERRLRAVIRTSAAEVAPEGLLERIRDRCREIPPRD